MNRFLKSLAFSIPLIISILLIYYKSINDHNIILSINYSIYVVTFLLSLLVLIGILIGVVVSTYAAILMIFNIKQIFKKKGSDGNSNG